MFAFKINHIFSFIAFKFLNMDTSRSLTSSPFEVTSAFRLVNPLTISVSNEASDLQCTPIKQDSSSLNSSQSSSSNDSSINIDSNEAATNKTGLLTYSTPVVSHYLTSFTSAKQCNQRKPSVNFHSIDDIVYGGYTSQNDSGFASSINTTKSPTSVRVSSVVCENKENSSSRESIDNSKKVRTTFTDHQKNMLDVYFRKNPYPDPSETEELSRQLVLPENVIKVWFQNKRSRDKQRQFSHAYSKSKNMLKNQGIFKKDAHSAASIYDSPLVANLKNISSKFNSYTAAAAIAAFAHVAQSGSHYYNNQSPFYSS